MSSGPRVLFLGHGAERTGPPLYLLRFLRWLATAHAPRPTVILGRDGVLVPEFRRVSEVLVASRGAEPLEPLAAALRRAGSPSLATAASDRFLRMRLSRVEAPALVHVNGCSPVTARLLDALPDWGVPVVVHVHELDIGLTHNLDTPQRDLLLKGTHPVFSVCNAVTGNLVSGHHIDPARISLHPGFVADPSTTVAPAPATRRAAGIPEDAFVIGTAALPDWRKAPDLLLRTAWELRRTRPDIDLHVVWVGGDPRSLDGWQAGHEARHLGLADRFHHLAEVADPTAVLAALDVYVSTAREDAFPLAAIEAAGAGVPIATFATGGLPELVGHDAGVVVPYPDTAALAEHLARLHDDPASRTAMGDAAARHVGERFTTATRAPQLWHDLCAVAGRAP